MAAQHTRRPRTPLPVTGRCPAPVPGARQPPTRTSTPSGLLSCVHWARWRQLA